MDVLEGQTTTADFVLGERVPGHVSLVVLVNGTPAPGLDVALRSVDTQDPTELRCTTDATGTSAPVQAFPGLYRVHLRDPEQGWNDWCPEQMLVVSGASVPRTVAIAVTSGTLECTQAGGLPLANETLTVLRASEHAGFWNPVATRQTDGLGRVELRLTPGDYALRRGEFQPFAEASVTVHLTWTASGPFSARVQF